MASLCLSTNQRPPSERKRHARITQSYPPLATLGSMCLNVYFLPASLSMCCNSSNNNTWETPSANRMKWVVNMINETTRMAHGQEKELYLLFSVSSHERPTHLPQVHFFFKLFSHNLSIDGTLENHRLERLIEF